MYNLDMNAETYIERIKSGLYYWRSSFEEHRKPMFFLADTVMESSDAAHWFGVFRVPAFGWEKANLFEFIPGDDSRIDAPGGEIAYNGLFGVAVAPMGGDLAAYIVAGKGDGSRYMFFSGKTLYSTPNAAAADLRRHVENECAKTLDEDAAARIQAQLDLRMSVEGLQ